MIWLILYVVPIILGAVFIWTSLEEGETIGDFYDDCSNEQLFLLMGLLLVPFVNLLTLLVSVPGTVINLTKNIKK
jgi:hypothetical protein